MTRVYLDKRGQVSARYVRLLTIGRFEIALTWIDGSNRSNGSNGIDGIDRSASGLGASSREEASGVGNEPGTEAVTPADEEMMMGWPCDRCGCHHWTRAEARACGEIEVGGPSPGTGGPVRSSAPVPTTEAARAPTRAETGPCEAPGEASAATEGAA